MKKGLFIIIFMWLLGSSLVLGLDIDNDYKYYYKFDNDLTDESGNHDGTNQGVDFNSGGKENQKGTWVEANTDYFTVSDHADIDATTNACWSFWIQFDDKDTSDRILMKSGAYAIQLKDTGVGECDSGICLCLVAEGLERECDGAGWVDIGSGWTHVVIVHEQAGQHYYLNGTKKTYEPYSTSRSFNSNGNDLYFGQNGGGGSEWFGGEIDEFKYFKENCTQADVTALYTEFDGGGGGSNNDHVAFDAIDNTTKQHSVYVNFTTTGNYSYSEFYQDGTLKANTSNKYYNYTGLTASTEYNFTVEIFWNTSLFNSTELIITTLDEPPVNDHVAFDLIHNTTGNDAIYVNFSTTGNYSYTEFYLNETLKANTSNKYYNYTGLVPLTEYNFTLEIYWNTTLFNTTELLITTGNYDAFGIMELNTNLTNNTNYYGTSLSFNYSASFTNTSVTTGHVSLFTNGVHNETLLNVDLTAQNIFNITFPNEFEGYFNISINASTTESNDSTGLIRYNVDSLSPVVAQSTYTNNTELNNNSVSSINATATCTDSNLFSCNFTLYRVNSADNSRLQMMTYDFLDSISQTSVTMNVSNSTDILNTGKFELWVESWDDHNPLARPHELTKGVTKTKTDLRLKFNRGDVEIYSQDTNGYDVIDQDNKYRVRYNFKKYTGNIIYLKNADDWVYRKTKHKAHLVNYKLKKYFDLNSDEIRVRSVRKVLNNWVITVDTTRLSVLTHSIGDLNQGTASYYMTIVNTSIAQEIETSSTFTSPDFENSTSNFLLKFNWSNVNISSIRASIHYNRTYYPSSVRDTFTTDTIGEYNFSVNVTTPLVSTNTTDVSFNWSYNYTELKYFNRNGSSFGNDGFSAGELSKIMDNDYSTMGSCSGGATCILYVNFTGLNTSLDIDLTFSDNIETLNHSINDITLLCNLTGNILRYRLLHNHGTSVNLYSCLDFDENWQTLETNLLATGIYDFDLKQQFTEQQEVTANEVQAIKYLYNHYNVVIGDHIEGNTLSNFSFTRSDEKFNELGASFHRITNDATETFTISKSGYANFTKSNHNTATNFNQEIIPYGINNVTYLNFTQSGASKIIRNLTYIINYTCLPASTTYLDVFLDDAIDETITLSCTDVPALYNGSFAPDSEGVFDLAFYFNTTHQEQDSNEFGGNDSFTFDESAPTINLTVNLTSGFGLPNITMSFTCTDSFAGEMVANYTYNNATFYYNATYANNTKIENNTQAIYGLNKITGYCSDLFSTATEELNFTVYFNNIVLINEKNNSVFSIDAISGAKVFYDDNSSLFDFKTEGTSEVNFSTLNQDKLRFELEYADGAIITRYIDVSLVEDQELRICANPENTTHYEQLVLSLQEKPVIIKNIYSDCLIAGDYTRFTYQESKVLKAFTIDSFYKLWTHDTDGNQLLLASLDGSIQSFYNLDTLEFQQTAYNLDIGSDSISFQKQTDNQIKIYYQNLGDSNQEIDVTISRLDTSTDIITFNEDDFTNNDDWTIYFDWTTLNNVTNTTLFKINVDRTTINNDDFTTTKYFNVKANSGVIKSEVAFMLGFMLLLFGFSFVASRFAFSWFGIVLTISVLGLTALAVATWYLLFLQALSLIVLIYTVILMMGQNPQTVS